MKAQEYVDAYLLDVKNSDDLYERVHKMFLVFLDEFKEICKTRNIKTVSGEEGVVRELNDKWNSIAAKVEKMYHQPLVKRNAVWNILLHDTDPVRWPAKPN